jgi:hypothetical protein
VPSPGARIRAAHLLALSAFAIAQPIFAHLEKEPYYFAVEGFRALDVLLYALIVLLVPPAFLLGVEFLAARIHPKVAAIAHGFIVGVFAFFICMALLSRAFSGNVAVVGALWAALMVARLYKTWKPAQLFLSISAGAAVLFLVFFLAQAPLGKLATTEARAVTMPHVASKTPVVLVIFDEFPVSSLMSDSRHIDAARNPNFAAFARTATWFRSATTIHDFTYWAVPAILTGQTPRYSQLPLLADHPENVFTLLGRNYRIRALETATRMCPKSLCAEAREPFGTRMSRLASHVSSLFPRGKLLTDIPGWRNPPTEVARFLAQLRRTPAAQLDVLHVLLPHAPWLYLPSGRSYNGTHRLVGYTAATGRWGAERRPVDQQYERHLLQVGYVDRVLGQIVHRLQAAGLWDRSLVIVTADHGISFRPGNHRRFVDSENIGDIAPIPLLVKRPGQRTGTVDDRSARTTDILPTIADVLGIHVPWKVDGHSLFAPGRPLPSEIVVASAAGGSVKASWRDVKAARDATIALKTRLFGTGTESLFAEGRDRRLIGKVLREASVAKSSSVRAQLERPSSTIFTLRSSVAPSRIIGTVVGSAGKALKLAVAVNGRIAAVTTTYAAGNAMRFSTLVPDSAFRAGPNAIVILAVRKQADGSPAFTLLGSG